MNLPPFDLSADLREVPEIEALSNQVLEMSAETFDQLSDQLHRYQPILLSSALAYHVDGLHADAVGGMLQNYSLMWLRFENRPKIKQKQITARMLNQSGKLNAAFLKYWQGEPSAAAATETLQQSLAQIKEKALFVWMMRYVMEGAAFQEIRPDEKHQLVFDLKCILDCLEDIAGMRT